MVSLDRQLSELAVEPCLAAFVSFFVMFVQTDGRGADDLPSDARVGGEGGRGSSCCCYCAASAMRDSWPDAVRCMDRRGRQLRRRQAVVVALETRHSGQMGRERSGDDALHEPSVGWLAWGCLQREDDAAAAASLRNLPSSGTDRARSLLLTVLSTLLQHHQCFLFGAAPIQRIADGVLLPSVPSLPLDCSV